MSRLFARTALLACALLAFPACDSNDDDDDGGGGGVGTAATGEGRAALSGSLSGSLRGSSYASILESPFTDGTFIYVVLLDSEVATSGLDSYDGDALAFALFPSGDEEGEYRISLLGGFGAPGGGSAGYGEDSEIGDDQYVGGSGTVTLTSVSSTRVIGSFDIDLSDILDDDFAASARGNFNATLIDEALFD